MLLHCLKCRKDTKSKNPKVVKKKKMEEHCFYKIMDCVIVNNQDLSKTKKITDF